MAAQCTAVRPEIKEEVERERERGGKNECLSNYTCNIHFIKMNKVHNVYKFSIKIIALTFVISSCNVHILSNELLEH